MLDQQPVSRALRALGWGVGLGAAAGLGTLAYSAGIEVRNFVVRRAEIAVLPPGQRPLKVLHVSDLHLTPTQGVKRRWLASLADLEPDLVVNTGDNLAHMQSVPPLVEGLGRLLDLPGVFVFGSNDYFAPTLRNPLWYLFPDDGQRNTNTPKLPWQDLRAAFEGRGWTDLTNTRGRLTVGDTSLAFVGVDDPHLGYDDLGAVAGPAPADADVRIGVAHAPYLRVLDQYARDGYDVTFAGPHPRRPGLPAVQGRHRHQLRPRHQAGQGSAPAPGRLTTRRSRLLLAARLGRRGDLAVRADQVLLPPRGDPADAAPEGLLSAAGPRLETRFGAPNSL